jgi:hypothetical protein
MIRESTTPHLEMPRMKTKADAAPASCSHGIKASFESEAHAMYRRAPGTLRNRNYQPAWLYA